MHVNGKEFFGMKSENVGLTTRVAPSRSDGNADTSYVEKAAREVAQAMRDGHTYTVLIKSTVPIGTNRRAAHVVGRVLQDRGISPKVFFASNPEFLREGQAL